MEVGANLRLTHRSVPITDRSSVGEARRAAMQIALTLGFSEERRNDIGIVATEAATNVLLHAQAGELLICPSAPGDSTWLDLLALDSGPGIADTTRAMEDGFSTGGTQGQGLGAIARLSDSTSLYSTVNKGTAAWSRFVNGSPTAAMASGVVNVPLAGENVCGDGYIVEPGAGRAVFMVVDGLGHGVLAAEAAHEAVMAVSGAGDEGPSEMMVRAHETLKKTRGAAMSIAVMDYGSLVLRYAGVGNCGGVLVTGATERGMPSQNGTVGVVLPRVVQEYTYPVERSTSLLLYSDGVNTRASLRGYPGLQNRHHALIAGILFRDFARRRDDTTVLVAPLGRELR